MFCTHMQGKCAKFIILTQTPHTLLEVGWSKRRQTSKICLGEETKFKIWAIQEYHLRNKSYHYFFKIKNLKFLEQSRVRWLESKLFHYPITQDIMVDTFECSQVQVRLGITCMLISYQGEKNHLSSKLYSRMSKGLSVGSLLAVLNSYF